jgi:Uri superfamily endonuclease
MIDFMEKKQWSYIDYMNTPQRIIELICMKEDVEKKKSEIDSKNNIDNKLKK